MEDLHKANTLDGSLQQTLTYFLFSCYTALRYCDIIQLKTNDLINGCVYTKQEKTDKTVTIPLITKALDLLSPEVTGKCFKTFTNQATNRFLKDIMKEARINKKITYHCSRHTFGTLSIFWGIPLEVVADLMGLNFKTVKVYAKIMDQVKVREMQKWELKAV